MANIPFLNNAYFAAKVGIGVQSPTVPLDVSGIIKTNTSFVGNAVIINQVTAATSSGRILFKNNSGSDKMAMEDNGNFGIGTTSPSQKLEVSGNSLVTGTQFIGDTFTKIQQASGNLLLTNQSSSGAIRFLTNNTERVRITSAGNVGIGTTSPGDKLHIFNAGYPQLNLESNAGSWQVGVSTGNDFAFRKGTSGSNYPLWLDSSGNVGIGTTNPLNKLFVSASTAGDYAGFIENTNSTNGYGLVARTAHTGTSAYAFAARAGTSDIFVVRGDGNVGIGTTSPSRKLHVHADSGSAYLQLTQAATGTTSNDGFQISMGAAQVNFINRENGNMVFETNNTEKMRITNTGNVGIGTTSPAHKLTINALNDTTAVGIDFPSAHFDFAADSTSGYNTLFKMDDTGLDIGHDSTARALNLKTGNLDRVTILGNGNVGIGTTSPSYPLDVVGDGIRLTRNSKTFIFNADFASAGTHANIQSDAGMGLSFSTNASEKMRITAAGNVGIGTTSPSQKLHINNSTASSASYAKFSNAQTGITTADGFDVGVNTGAEAVIWQRENANLLLATNNSERMRITAAGILMVGGTTGGYSGTKIHVGNFTDTQNGINILTSTTGYGYVLFGDGTGADTYRGQITYYHGDDSMSFNTNGSEKLRIVSGGGISFAGATNFGSAGQVLKSNGSASPAWVDASTVIGGPYLPLAGGTMTGVTQFNDHTQHGDQVSAKWGAGNDLTIKHNATDSFIENYTGHLSVVNYSNDKDIIFWGDDGTGGIAQYLVIDGGAVETRFLKSTRHFDDVGAYFGDSADLQIYHDGSNSYIDEIGTGFLNIQSDTALVLANGAGEPYFIGTSNSSVKLYYDNSKKLETTTSGITVTGGWVTSGVSVAQASVEHIDNAKAMFGNGNDLQIYHSASHSYINDTGTGDLYIQASDNMYFQTYGSGKRWITLTENAGVDLFYNDIHKLSTGAVSVGTATTAGGTLIDGWKTTTQANAINDTTIATTAYVNNKIALIPAGLVFQGTWNAATNTPTLTSGSGTTGHFYIVSTDGSTNLDGITDWKVGDWAVFVEQGASDQWEKVDNSSVLDGSGTGQKVTMWSGSGTSNTLTDAPITISGSNTTVTGKLGIGALNTGFNLYNNGTTYLNGATTVDDAFTQSGGLASTFSGDVTATANYSAGNSKIIYKAQRSGGAVAGDWSYDDATTDMSLGTSTAHSFSLKTGNTRALTLNSSQNATFAGSITAPSSLNFTANAAYIKVGTSWNTGVLNFLNGSTTYLQFDVPNGRIRNNLGKYLTASSSVGQFGTFDNFATVFVVNNTEKMRINSSGNVGIGTSNPVEKLQINSGDVLINNSTVSTLKSGGSLYIDLNTFGSYSGRNFRISDNGTSLVNVTQVGNVGIGTTSPSEKLVVQDGKVLAGHTNTRGYGFHDLSNYTYTANTGRLSLVSNGTEAVSIDSEQRVGIGITNPAGLLHIKGDTNSNGAEIYLQVDNNNTTDNLGAIHFGNNVDATLSEISSGTSGANNSSYIRFATSNTGAQAEKMRISATGNVGIGTTSPVYKLDVNGGVQAGGKVTYTKSAGSLNTTGYAVAGITADANGNGSSCGFTFTCFGHTGGYQKIVYSCYNGAGTWYAKKVINEGTNQLDVVASANGSTITFTFKAISSTMHYTPRVTVEATGNNINSTYA